MGKRERGIQDRTVLHLIATYKKKVVVRVKHGDAYAVAGDPDLYGCIYGHFFAFEIKNEDGTLTNIQIHRLKELSEANALVGAIRSPQEAVTILDKYLRSQR